MGIETINAMLIDGAWLDSSKSSFNFQKEGDALFFGQHFNDLQETKYGSLKFLNEKEAVIQFKNEQEIKLHLEIATTMREIHFWNTKENFGLLLQKKYEFQQTKLQGEEA